MKKSNHHHDALKEKKLTNKLYIPFFLFAALFVLCSHNLYIKMGTYFLKPNEQTILSLYNGTFENSENIIARDRILDASIMFQGKRLNIDPSQWIDKDSTITQFKFAPIETGTYVAGVSTKARNIELSAQKFNDYLEHDGVLDILQERTDNNLLDQDAVESYEKHVKAIFQVGEDKTNDWSTSLGYPIEFIPLSNPYEKYSGEKIEVKLLLDGEPLSNQLVFADYIHTTHDHGHDHREHNHDHDGNKHSHDHDKKEHEHEHRHEGDKHDHDHKHDDGKHNHDHDEKEHGHEHEHEGDKHTHDHKHDNKKHDHDHKNHDHSHGHGQQLRTNDLGVVTVDLPEDGIYYLRTIHMVGVTDNEELTHRSKWATLTFEVSHKHDDSSHSHDDHDHDHEGGIPTWGFILGSLLIIAILFFIFRKKN